MQTCQIRRKLWEKVIFRCQKEGRIHGDIKATVRNWIQKPYHSKLLNALSQLIPGLLMWNIWKERNRRVFKDQSMSIEQLWTMLCQNIKESLSIKTWSPEDFPSTSQEKFIWDNWNLHLNQEPTSKDSPSPRNHINKMVSTA